MFRYNHKKDANGLDVSLLNQYFHFYPVRENSINQTNYFHTDLVQGKVRKVNQAFKMHSHGTTEYNCI